MSRRERLREETTTEIKRVAREQLAAHGTSGISLRKIAAEIGMTAPALYTYFSSYDALITALITDAFAALADALEAGDASETGHRARLRAVMLAYRAWAVQHPHDYMLIFGTPIPNYEAPSKAVSPQALRAQRVLHKVLTDAGVTAPISENSIFHVWAPQFSQLFGFDVSPEVVYVAQLLWSRMHGVVSLEITRPSYQQMGADLYAAEVENTLGLLNI